MADAPALKRDAAASVPGRGAAHRVRRTQIMSICNEKLKRTREIPNPVIRPRQRLSMAVIPGSGPHDPMRPEKPDGRTLIQRQHMIDPDRWRDHNPHPGLDR